MYATSFSRINVGLTSWHWQLESQSLPQRKQCFAITKIGLLIPLGHVSYPFCTAAQLEDV
jgi:hypothetical protein